MNRTIKRMPILLAGCFGVIHLTSAEEVVYPGNPDHPGYAEYGSLNYFEYDSVLIRLIQKMDGSRTARKAVIDRIKDHPEEVNDWWSHDGWSGTPLTEAMQKKDIEIVSLLLANGAIPYPPPGASFWKNRAEGSPEYSDMIKLIHQAQQKYPVYTRILYSDSYRKSYKK